MAIIDVNIDDLIINLDPKKIEEIVKSAFKAINDAIITKAKVQFPKEIWGNLEIMRNLYSYDKIKSIKVNDSYISKKLKGVKTDAMQKILDYYWADNQAILSKKGIDFYFLAIAIDKIKRLKALNAMSNGKLKNERKTNIAVRVRNIIKALTGIIKK